MFSKRSADKIFIDGQSRITFVRPPIQCKDWSKFLVDYGDEMIKAWIEKHEKYVSEDVYYLMRMMSL